MTDNKVIEVIIVCRTCEHFNSMNRGMPDYIEAQTEFESLTDAYEHLLNNRWDEPRHDMAMFVRENK